MKVPFLLVACITSYIPFSLAVNEAKWKSGNINENSSLHGLYFYFFSFSRTSVKSGKSSCTTMSSIIAAHRKCSSFIGPGYCIHLTLFPFVLCPIFFRAHMHLLRETGEYTVLDPFHPSVPFSAIPFFIKWLVSFNACHLNTRHIHRY